MSRQSPADPDPKALQLARAIHEAEQPKATILFGSRARGDHSEADSDIDILMVVEETPYMNSNPEANRRAKATALALYQRQVAIQLVCMDELEFAREEHYVDSAAGAALHHGILAGGDPARFTSIYNTDDPPPFQYSFHGYDYHFTRSRHDLNTMITLHRGESPLKKYDPWLAAAENVANDTNRDPEDLYILIRHRAKTAITEALMAATWAAPAVPSNRDTTAELLHTLQRLIPGLDLSTRIPVETYDNPTAPLQITKTQFAEAAQADIAKVRATATRLKRLTGNAAKRAKQLWDASHT